MSQSVSGTPLSPALPPRRMHASYSAHTHVGDVCRVLYARPRALERCGKKTQTLEKKNHQSRHLKSLPRTRAHLSSPPPPSSSSRSKLSVARRPPSRWSTARRARVSSSSTVRVSSGSAMRRIQGAVAFRVHPGWAGWRRAVPRASADDAPLVSARAGNTSGISLRAFARAISVANTHATAPRRRLRARPGLGVFSRNDGGELARGPRTPLSARHRRPHARPNPPTRDRDRLGRHSTRVTLTRSPSLALSQARPLSSCSPRRSSSRRWSPSCSSAASASPTSTSASA